MSSWSFFCPWICSLVFSPIKTNSSLVYPVHVRNLINHSYHKKLTVWNLQRKRSTSREFSSAPGLHPTAHCHRLGAAFFCLWTISCFSPANQSKSQIVYPVHLIGRNLGNHINYNKELHEVLHAIFLIMQASTDCDWDMIIVCRARIKYDSKTWGKAHE